MSTGKRRSWPSDEKPVPKSSIAIRTPRSCSSCSSARARSPAAPRPRSRSRSPRCRGSSRAAPRTRAPRCTSVVDPAGGQLLAGHVDPRGERLGQHSVSRHCAVWAQASRSTKSPSGMIRPVASATGMNSSGVTSPRVGECPAQQRLDADDRARCRAIDLGLVVDAELVPLEAEPQLVLEPEQLAELARHVVVEHLVAAAPRFLRRVHRHVGVANQLLAAPGPPGGSTIPMLAPSASSWPAIASAPRAHSSRRLRQRDGVGFVGAVEQQRELVAAQPRERVAGPGDLREALARLPGGARSPASWPRLSLTCLKPSRSTSSTARNSRSARSAPAPGRAGRGTGRGWPAR